MHAAPRRRHPFFLARLPVLERAAVAETLRRETTGGLMALAAAMLALGWANSPWSDCYEAVREFHFGLPVFGLDLSVEHWVSEGLLTVFFLVAGTELKRELVTGELRNPAAAVVPVASALAGMVVPAGVYLAVVGLGGGDTGGWAVPTATDIAFALAVLAVIGMHLPPALRAFLLTLAVVDDLGAIIVIAAVFTSDMNVAALVAAAACLALFCVLQRFGVRGWWWYLPLGVVMWALTHASGVHATVAGVAMGLALRVARDEDGTAGDHTAATPSQQVEYLARPVSAGVAVPLFALFAAGVSISAPSLGEVLTRPEALGVVLGLVVGKPVGILLGAYVAARIAHARLSPGLDRADVVALSLLGGVGFTVALLIGELAFAGPADAERVKAAVLLGSLIAGTVAAVLLKSRDRHYRRLLEEEQDADGPHGSTRGRRG